MTSVRPRRGSARGVQAELALVEQAIRFVASGHASRVVVANLRHGRLALEAAGAFAAASGVDLAPIAAADGRRIDIVAAVPA